MMIPAKMKITRTAHSIPAQCTEFTLGRLFAFNLTGQIISEYGRKKNELKIKKSGRRCFKEQSLVQRRHFRPYDAHGRGNCRVNPRCIPPHVVKSHLVWKAKIVSAKVTPQVIPTAISTASTYPSTNQSINHSSQ